MTLDEADAAVAAASEAREDAINAVLEAVSVDLFEALEKLHETQCAYYDAIEVWGELDDAKKKST
jgi:cob(I)alamin adenosyltransferase